MMPGPRGGPRPVRAAARRLGWAARRGTRPRMADVATLATAACPKQYVWNWKQKQSNWDWKRYNWDWKQKRGCD